MSLPVAIACVLAAAVLFASVRLAWRSQHAAVRPQGWRLGFVLFAQAASAALLFFTLFPPASTRSAGTLTVLTARADEVRRLPSAGGRVVALPEAPPPGVRWSASMTGAERVPDLATALRRYPDARRIDVVGAGLVARDRGAVRGHALVFHPAPLPRGLIDVQPPQRVAAGRRFELRGTAHALPDGRAELRDPAGRRVDRVALDAGGGFVLRGSARSPGPANWRLRLADARGRMVEDAPLALDVAPPRRLRALALAGAPNAELKFLRRWALDAGIDLDTRIELGGGLQIGGVALDAASLDRADLLLADLRSWRALGAGQRAAILAAVGRGLGLLLRVDAAPGAAERQALRSLGFGTTAGAAKETRLGAGFVRAGDAADALPTLTATARGLSAVDGAIALADAAGAPLAAWRAHGRGRIGVAAFDGSYRLALAGRSDAHGETWGRLSTLLARAASGADTPTIATAPPQQRSTLCGIADTARVETPDGRRVALRVDPRSGPARCAGYWATQTGWHALIDGARRTPFHVDDRAGIAARTTRDATLALVADRATDASGSTAVPGPRWPWFVAWLLLTAALWWLERSRAGLRLAPAASVRK